MNTQNHRSSASSVEDFRRARRRAALEAIMSRLTGKSADLLSYEQVRQKLRAREKGARELRDIPLDAIVGSVGRYSDFTRSFFPRQDSAQERWVGVQTAMVGMTGVPPIKVYQIGGAYFIEDGNHRVSVARQLGTSHIEAYVTQVRTRVPLSPDTPLDDLIVKAEYADFLEYTQLDRLRPEANVGVTVPGQYDELEQHIEIHHYLLSVERGRDVPYEEGVTHWYDEFYLPVVQVIREQGVLRDFPGRTETDLYVWTVKHQVALQGELGWEIGLRSAASDLAAQFSPTPRRVVGRVSKRILDTVTPDSLGAGPPPGQWRGERQLSQPSDRLFADILVAVNGKESGWNALEWAMTVAQQDKARLHGLHVVPTEHNRGSDEARAVQEEYQRRCEAASFKGDLVVEAGNVPRLVNERSRLVDLVVLSLSRARTPQPIDRPGSGMRAILRRCATPVLAVPMSIPRLERMLLAYDGSAKADEALFIATYLARRLDIPLVVVTVMESGRTSPDTLTDAQNYLESHGVQPTLVRESGPAAKVILIAAEEHAIDLIILGGYSASPIVELALGSTLETLLRSSGRPVLICR